MRLRRSAIRLRRPARAGGLPSASCARCQPRAAPRAPASASDIRRFRTCALTPFRSEVAYDALELAVRGSWNRGHRAKLHRHVVTKALARVAKQRRPRPVVERGSRHEQDRHRIEPVLADLRLEEAIHILEDVVQAPDRAAVAQPDRVVCAADDLLPHPEGPPPTSPFPPAPRTPQTA